MCLCTRNLSDLGDSARGEHDGGGTGHAGVAGTARGRVVATRGAVIVSTQYTQTNKTGIRGTYLT
jgi:hypothetical protein